MKIKQIDDEMIFFDNGYILVYEHEQDCCESVFADFSMLSDYNISPKTGKIISIYKIDFEETLAKLIEPIENEGFCLQSKKGEKFFVPCHDIQNGYYSNNLTLKLMKIAGIMDVSGCTKFEEC